MASERTEKFAFMAGFAALATGRLPRWLRVTLIFSLASLACAAGLAVYRYATHPAALTVATGFIDGDATRLMSAVAAWAMSTCGTQPGTR